MSRSFHVQRRVEFRETDAAGIAHFSSYFAYMEEAEHALFRELGLSVMVPEEGGTIGFPRVSAQCDYRGAAHFEELLDVAVTIARLGTKSITFRFQFSRHGQVVADGQMTSVCCRMRPNQPPRSEPIPPRIAALLAPYVEA